MKQKVNIHQPQRVQRTQIKKLKETLLPPFLCGQFVHGKRKIQ